MPSWSTPHVPTVANTTPPATVQSTARSVTDVAVRTTSQACGKEDPSDHPEEAEPSIPEMQAHHSGEDATLAAGTTLATPLNAPPAGTTGPLPTVPPTVLPTTINAAPAIIMSLGGALQIDTIGDPHPSEVTRTAFR